MTETKTAADPRATAKAQIIDALRRRLSVQEAVAAVGISRRTAYGWREADPAFAAAWQEAVEDAANLISRQQVADWRAELAQLEAEMAQVEAALGDVAAPAQAGCPESIAKRDELRARHQKAQEGAGALRVAIESGAQHIARQDAEKAERDRQAAATESDQLHQQQVAAAREIDDALRTLASAWATFTDASAKRQSAARRAGGSARPAFQHQLAAAFFAVAPSVADALRIARMNRAACQPLAESIR